ncbi:MAG: type I-E CRISPR-associated protein Cas5/CasD [Rhodobiaceae bacterium]|nr:type I-E CRISPR-associated protein Cas5/CasD [Paracoccaceae bacterium]MCB1474094.1 type I-E CRISPR-associated protein Cas5/CasD [Rhodobiaceae bacterium]
MNHRWLVLDLCAPLMAFGGVAVDQVGPTRDFPAASMLTGLLANALGWHWSDREAHEGLQRRLVFGAAALREGRLLTDTQNAQLAKNDSGWTTRGRPEGRDGASYYAPHRRLRSYLADAYIAVVLRLEPAEVAPDLNAIAAALARPARPLFIGRKPCLPSAPILRGEVTAERVFDALIAAGAGGCAATWPAEEGPQPGDKVERIDDLPDLRNWHSGVHAGSRRVVIGRL